MCTPRRSEPELVATRAPLLVVVVVVVCQRSSLRARKTLCNRQQGRQERARSVCERETVRSTFCGEGTHEIAEQHDTLSLHPGGGGMRAQAGGGGAFARFVGLIKPRRPSRCGAARKRKRKARPRSKQFCLGCAGGYSFCLSLHGGGREVCNGPLLYCSRGWRRAGAFWAVRAARARARCRLRTGRGGRHARARARAPNSSLVRAHKQPFEPFASLLEDTCGKGQMAIGE